MSELKDAKRRERLSEDSEFFQNPWSDETRKLRRNLLLTSTAGIIMAAAGIFPKEISALGLKVDDIDQHALLIVFAIVIAYLTFSYIFYTYSDFMHSFWSELSKVETLELPTDEFARELILTRMKWKGRLQNIHMIRIIIDVAIPIVAGFIALVWLLAKM